VLISSQAQFTRCSQETHEESTALSPEDRLNSLTFLMWRYVRRPAKKEVKRQEAGGTRLRTEEGSWFGCNQK